MKHLITQGLDSEAGCILSDWEHYRYRLWREWDRRRPKAAERFIELTRQTCQIGGNE